MLPGIFLEHEKRFQPRLSDQWAGPGDIIGGQKGPNHKKKGIAIFHFPFLFSYMAYKALSRRFCSCIWLFKKRPTLSIISKILGSRTFTITLTPSFRVVMRWLFCMTEICREMLGCSPLMAGTISQIHLSPLRSTSNIFRRVGWARAFKTSAFNSIAFSSMALSMYL